MDMGIIIAIMGSTIAIVGVVIAMMFWCRQESNSLRIDQKEDRIGFMQAREEDRKEMIQLLNAIDKEIRDFHYQMIELRKGKH